MKWMMLAAQIVALLAWIYLRRCAPVERFWLDNMYAVGHLLVAVGLLGPAVFRLEVIVGLAAIGAALGYNFLSYGQEYRAYSYLPVEARENQPTSASRVNQVMVTSVCWIGAMVLMGMTVAAMDREFSRWTFLTMLPGLSGGIAALSEAWHRSRRTSKRW